MPSALGSLIVLFALQAPAHRSLEANIPPANRAILTSGQWTPSAEQGQKALLAIQAFLERSIGTSRQTNLEIKKILQNSGKYRVQFIGVLRNRRKVIRCNFFPAPTGNRGDEFENWRKTEVMVMDGGFWFWEIEYDPATGKCDHFISNGYA